MVQAYFEPIREQYPKGGQTPLCEAPFGPFRQRGLTPLRILFADWLEGFGEPDGSLSSRGIRQSATPKAAVPDGILSMVSG
jgi:hypothetical protein